MKNLISDLKFYFDNDLDEIISEEQQNYFIKKDDFAINNLAIENKSLENNEKLTQIKKQNFSQKANILRESKIEKTDFYDFNKDDKPKVKKINSTFEAISNLAQRAKNSGVNLNQKFMSIDKIIEQAKEKAQNCQTISELKKAVEEFDGCNLKKMATNTVFCDGNHNSKIMIIGEAPGNHEDLNGIPFCGDSGILLDNMFQAINMKRSEDYYITNVIFWRPPGNRRPTEEELKICRPFVERHIQLVDPKMIILVGATSMSAVLGLNDPISKVRGKVIKHKFDFMEREVDNFIIFHPSYLMRQSAKKKIAWRDMLELEKIL